MPCISIPPTRSNNTNKFSPQEQKPVVIQDDICSNNTNKFSPQEPATTFSFVALVQIIQINSALKNQYVSVSSCLEFK